MWRKALVVWLVLLVVAVLNGALREAVLTPVFGAPSAHVLSTLVLSALVLALATASAGWIGARNDAEAVRVGALWTGLVLAFEFLAGHFLFGRSWEYLLADYDVAAGRIWVLVPMVTLFAPLVAERLRKRRAQASVAPPAKLSAPPCELFLTGPRRKCRVREEHSCGRWNDDCPSAERSAVCL